MTKDGFDGRRTARKEEVEAKAERKMEGEARQPPSVLLLLLMMLTAMAKEWHSGGRWTEDGVSRRQEESRGIATPQRGRDRGKGQTDYDRHPVINDSHKLARIREQTGST